MFLTVDDLAKLGLAVVLAGLVGAEREFHDKAAGFRTMILISVGATLFTVFSLRLAGEVGGDPVRIAAGVVTGIGFLGAGAILRDGGRITGLTTASTIWLAAAIGMGVGAGQWAFTTAATGIILVVLLLFPRVEFWIDNLRHTTTYEFVFAGGPDRREAIRRLFSDCGLRVRGVRLATSAVGYVYRVEVSGPPRCHDDVVGKLLAHEELIELRM
jgi:putative Mg2+ transporter-C (MgtC) family protein